MRKDERSRSLESGKPSDARERQTPSGIPIPLFLGEPDFLGETGAGRPGELPFTRGIYPDMYRGKLWTMRQYSGFGTARETNQRFRYLLAQGQTGLSVAFDLPTQIGYDSDDPAAAGEVGKVGVPICSIEDMEQLFAGIPLEEVSVSMTINASAAVLLAFLIALAKRRGMAPSRLRGTLQNDLLKEFVARHTQRFPLTPSLRLVMDVLEHSVRHLPHWHPISISGYHIREAGSTAVEEVALTLSHAVAYLEAARARQLPLAAVARKFSFFFAAQMHLFEEVAKFRAARRLWAHLVRDRFQIEDPEAAKLRFHTQTAGAALTYQEPENNAVRVALQALAAVLGGTQSLHTNALDEALGLPTEKTVRLALRTQQIIAFESGAADSADPLGGAPLIEHLTSAIEERAKALMAELEARGGALRAIQEGLPQRWIAASAYRLEKQAERGERIVVGVNRFGSAGEAPQQEVFQLDEKLEPARVEEVARRKRERPGGAAQAALQRLKEAARSTENLMETLIAGVEAGATLGEMMGSLAEVFGEHQGDW
ncbi:MAG: methylmalonyl-CoA mutase [Planctomycetes bacterium]|nr:methylmalonyl-CoA mutase [Planctomycetota bacterium]